MPRYSDMHCDTLMKAFLDGKPDVYEYEGTMLDFKRLKEGGSLLQFMAVFFPHPDMFEPRPNMPGKSPFANPKVKMKDYMSYFDTCADVFDKTCADHMDEIFKVFDRESYMAMKASGKVGAMLAIEDGVAAEGQMERIKYFFDRGVRALSITWNRENCFGYPTSQDPEIMKQGLKPFGMEAVEYMEELGIISDVSHLSDGGFYDIARLVKGPFVATHSNCRSVMDHRRNLTDDMIRVLAEHGGVMGLNWCPEFCAFADESKTSCICTADTLAEHAAHAVKVGGMDIVGIGTDFDGTGGQIEIDDPRKMHLLWDALAKKGFHESEIEKIAFGNVERVLLEKLPC